MRWAVFLIAVPLLAAAGFDLDALRWQNRLILTFAPAPEDPRLLQQSKALSDDQCGVADRDLVVVNVATSQATASGHGKLTPEEAAALRDKYGIAPPDFAVLLIGKDGGVKLRSSEPVSRRELFSLIDGMPMRRQEMRAGGSPCRE